MKEATVKVEPHKSSLGEMDANLLALFVYLLPIVLAWIPFVKFFAWAVPLVVFFIEKKSNFVRFHALQAILLSAVGAVLGFIFYLIVLSMLASLYYGSWGAYTFVSALAIIITIIIVVFEIIAMINAYGYKAYRIPLIGSLAAKWSGKLTADSETKGDG